MGLDDQLNNAKHGLTNKSRQNIGEDTNTNQPTDATSLEGPDIEVPTEDTSLEEPDIEVPTEDTSLEGPDIEVPTEDTSLEGPDIEVPTNEPGGTPKVGSLGAEDDEHDESASAGSESTLKIPNDFE